MEGIEITKPILVDSSPSSSSYSSKLPPPPAEDSIDIFKIISSTLKSLFNQIRKKLSFCSCVKIKIVKFVNFISNLLVRFYIISCSRGACTNWKINDDDDDHSCYVFITSKTNQSKENQEDCNFTSNSSSSCKIPIRKEEYINLDGFYDQKIPNHNSQSDDDDDDQAQSYHHHHHHHHYCYCCHTEKTPLLCKDKSQSPTSKNHFSSSKYAHSVDGGIDRCFDIKLLGIAIIFLGGFTTGLFLFLRQIKLEVSNFSLDLINYEVWRKTSSVSFLTENLLLNGSNVNHVIIMQTGDTGKCYDLENCTYLLIKMQKEVAQLGMTEIPYNFLISSNGQTYEIRGWDYASEFSFIPKNSSLVIGFIGDYTYESPTEEQLKNARSIIEESLRRRKINENYQIYGVQNLTKSTIDGNSLYTEILKWDRFIASLKIL